MFAVYNETGFWIPFWFRKYSIHTCPTLRIHLYYDYHRNNPRQRKQRNDISATLSSLTMTTVKNNDHQIIKYLWQYRVYSAAKKMQKQKISMECFTGWKNLKW